MSLGQAVAVLREAAGGQPDKFNPALCISLNNLSINLRSVGRANEALAAAQEAVDLARHITGSGRPGTSTELSMSLSNLASALAFTGRDAESEEAGREAEFLYSWSGAANEPFLRGEPFLVLTSVFPPRDYVSVEMDVLPVVDLEALTQRLRDRGDGR